MIAMGNECMKCGQDFDLEFHHTVPRQWTAAKYASQRRQVIYERDYIAGELELLCSRCNKTAGKPTDDDTPF